MAIQALEQQLEHDPKPSTAESKTPEWQRHLVLAASPRLLKTLAWTIACSRPFKFWQQPSAIFIAPAKPGSLGDDAMILAGIHYLKQQGFSKFSLVYPGQDCDWGHLGKFDTVLPISWPKDGIKRYTNSLYQYLKLAAQHSHIYCIGADVMDGFYSELITLNLLDVVNMAGLSGARTKIIGFSFNEHPKASAVAGLEQLPQKVELLCRDAVSKTRLEKQISKRVSLVADAAFLLVPQYDSSLVTAAQHWLRRTVDEESILIGLNICSTLVNLELGLSAEEVAKRYAQTFTQVATRFPQVRLLLIPHDTRGNISDISLLELFRQNLPTKLQERTYALSGAITAPEAKALCAELDLVVTGRMHLAIAALGQSTPVLGITYQGKFSGLFQHFDLERMTIAPSKSIEIETFAEQIIEQITRKDFIQGQLKRKLPQVQSLAQRNFHPH